MHINQASTDNPGELRFRAFRFDPLLSIATLAIGLFLGGGCAAGARAARGELPFGEWSGMGHYVYQRWGQPDGSRGEGNAPRSLHGDYPTRLSIRPHASAGRDAQTAARGSDTPQQIEIEIVSERGAIPQFEDRTHLLVALEKAPAVLSQTMLYRLIDFKFNPAAGEKLDWNKQGPPYSATAMDIGGRLLFQIHYTENFSDTLRFQDDYVIKSGAIFEEGEGLIHWYEMLGRQR